MIGVQRADECNVTDSALVRLSIPAMIGVDRDHYFLINNDDGSSTLYFNKALVGVEVIVTYPQKAEVQRRVANINNIGGVKVALEEIIKHDDGTTVVRYYNNVLITTFPRGISSTDDTEFAFTIAIMKDADGNWYTEDLIVA